MKLLHVGCGRQPLPDWLPNHFKLYEEVRLDIDHKVQPDIVASLTDLGDIGQFDAIFGTHVLEHLFPHEVVKAMSEFRRVLNPGGFVMMIVPNLDGIKPTREVVYQSTAGPITGLDMYYGKESMVEENPYMAHKTGFVPETMREAFKIFNKIDVRPVMGFNLMGVGVK